MKYHLAQLNIAHFKKPQDHPDNIDFVSNLDRVNEIAESQPGFIWRFTGEGNNALDVAAFDNPNIASNMSVWSSLESLGAFVYRNKEHREIMRRRAEWFEQVDFYLVLWWVPEAHIPTLNEAIDKLQLLKNQGPSAAAFTFKKPYPSPDGTAPKAVLDECA